MKIYKQNNVQIIIIIIITIIIKYFSYLTPALHLPELCFIITNAWSSKINIRISLFEFRCFRYVRVTSVLGHAVGTPSRFCWFWMKTVAHKLAQSRTDTPS
jgi:hypothetical protein